MNAGLHIVDETHGNGPMKEALLTFPSPTNSNDVHLADIKEGPERGTTVRTSPLP